MIKINEEKELEPEPLGVRYVLEDTDMEQYRQHAHNLRESMLLTLYKKRM